MRVFHIQPKGSFVEFELTPFEDKHEEIVLEDWLESNPDAILERGSLLVIGRQVPTDLGGYIDLLCLDRQGIVVVVELKRDKATREAIGQALEYLSSVEGLDAQRLEKIFRCYRKNSSLILAECHRSHFGLDRSLHLNRDQRIVIVAQNFTPGSTQTAAFLNRKGFHVTCVEFTFYQEANDNRLITHRVVVDKEASGKTPAPPGQKRRITEDEFLAACDENGKHLFDRMLKFAEQGSLEIRWSEKGFSLNVLQNETYIPVCYGSSREVWFGQMLYTAFHGAGGIIVKDALPENVIQCLLEQAKGTELFEPAGKRDLKCLITRKLTDNEIESVLAWCASVEKAIREYGLK